MTRPQHADTTPLPRSSRAAWGALVVLLGGLAVAGACAEGSSIADDEGSGVGGGGGSGATTGATSTTTGATTSSTASTSATTSSTSTGQGGEGGGGPPCSEDPCKLVLPQCGCPDGQQCTVGANGRLCVAEGSVGWGLQCGGADKCGPGLLCVQTAPPISSCAKFCATDADCTAPGGLCIIGLNDGNGGQIPDVTLCTPNCDPSTNVGCGVAGTSCQPAQEADGLMRFFTTCSASGAGTQNAACQTSDDCAPTYGCFTPQGGSPVCLKWCNVAQPSCPGAAACNAVTINGQPIQVGGAQYGACL